MQEAIDYLKCQGFSCDEIYTEFPVHNCYRHGDRYRHRGIDVVGISPKRRIAIECGQCSPAMLDLIRPYFHEVLHFPYR